MSVGTFVFVFMLVLDESNGLDNAKSRRYLRLVADASEGALLILLFILVFFPG